MAALCSPGFGTALTLPPLLHVRFVAEFRSNTAFSVRSSRFSACRYPLSPTVERGKSSGYGFPAKVRAPRERRGASGDGRKICEYGVKSAFLVSSREEFCGLSEPRIRFFGLPRKKVQLFFGHGNAGNQAAPDGDDTRRASVRKRSVHAVCRSVRPGTAAEDGGTIPGSGTVQNPRGYPHFFLVHKLFPLRSQKLPLCL
jgi:hypothetical protein